jgi:hypothetical protein
MNVRAFVGLGITAALASVLIPLWGAVGAAVAVSCGFLVYAVVSVWSFARVSGVPMAGVAVEIVVGRSALSGGKA